MKTHKTKAFHFLNQTFDALTQTPLGALALGIVVFSLFFDFTIIDPSNTAWMIRDGGDRLQHYLGSYAFRSDDWHFPLTKTVLINYPEGLSIIYTDSNPLLSLIAKMLKGIFPPEFQFFGFWFLLCWVLQSVFGYLVVRKLTNNSIYALLGGVLFCLLPTQLARVHHANLIAHWLILWTLYVFISQDIKATKKQVLFFLILFLTAMIHAYLTFMTFTIVLTWYIQHVIVLLRTTSYKDQLRFLGFNLFYTIVFLFSLWCLGFFYNTSDSEGIDGFGYYSMNLNAAFNCMYQDYSQFLNAMASVRGQYEGFQYWGFGVIVLFLFIIFLSSKKYKLYSQTGGVFILTIALSFFFIRQDQISLFDRLIAFMTILMFFSIGYILYKQKEKEVLFLFLPATICFIYALSHQMYLGETIFFDYKLESDAFYSALLHTTYSSGRFFWVTTLILLLGAIVVLFNLLEKKRAILFLFVIIVIQLLDLSKIQSLIRSEDRNYQSPLPDEYKKMILATDRVQFMDCFDMKVAEFALLNHKTINQFYVAHSSGWMTVNRIKQELIDFKNGKRDKDALYLLKSTHDLAMNKVAHLQQFYGDLLAIAPANRSTTHHPTLSVLHQQSDSLATLLQAIQHDPLVLISIKEDKGMLPDFFVRCLDSIYGCQFNKIETRNSYLAVFSDGKLMTESRSKENAVEYRKKILGHEIYLKSAGIDHGNVSIIKVDELNLSINDQGINVVTLSTQKLNSNPTEEVWKCYRFDTNKKRYTY